MNRKALLWLIVCAALAPSLRARADQSDDISAGKAKYTQRCAQCHGFNLVSAGTVAPDLRRFPREDHARFVTTVLDGRNGMPSWKGTLSANDIELLWTYVSSVAAQ